MFFILYIYINIYIYIYYIYIYTFIYIYIYIYICKLNFESDYAIRIAVANNQTSLNMNTLIKKIKHYTDVKKSVK